MECSLEGCDGKVIGRGFCGKHYQRFMKWGDPLYRATPGPAIRPVAERTWHRINKDGAIPQYDPALGPCWEWTGACTGAGYGHVGGGGAGAPMVVVHRWVYEQLVGPIPSGTELDHLCRVRHCCRPEHLEAVPHTVNLDRSPIAPAAINRRKTRCIRGHPFDEENTLVLPDGRRQCLTCRRKRDRELKRRQRIGNDNVSLSMSGPTPDLAAT